MPATPTILATSGGFTRNERNNLAPAGLVRLALRTSAADRPKLCFLGTATGDDVGNVQQIYAAFSGWSVDVSHLQLFTMPNVADVRSHLLGQDVIWVGGGSVANLLAVWRVHGVDVVMREAWESGVVLSGASAGSICWHTGGTTDSFGPDLRSVTDGLALLPYGNGVHYDSEEQRRPLLHALVGDGTLPTSYATDDGAGLLYEGTELVGTYAEREGAGAYRVEKGASGVVETRLAPELV